MDGEDLTGRTFGYLTVLRRADCLDRYQKRYENSRWLCRCTCGEEVVETTSRLIKRIARSCGCKTKLRERKSKDFVRRVSGEWMRNWGKYSKPFEFNIAVTELHEGQATK